MWHVGKELLRTNVEYEFYVHISDAMAGTSMWETWISINSEIRQTVINPVRVVIIYDIKPLR